MRKTSKAPLAFSTTHRYAFHPRAQRLSKVVGRLAVQVHSIHVASIELENCSGQQIGRLELTFSAEPDVLEILPAHRLEAHNEHDGRYRVVIADAALAADARLHIEMMAFDLDTPRLLSAQCEHGTALDLDAEPPAT
ncbi:MAG TPA: hypothetical protein VFF16_21335 [Telluria sp.]|nr:hypothetical protein [Telluria sp.]